MKEGLLINQQLFDDSPELRKFFRNEFDIALFTELSTRTNDEKIKAKLLDTANKLRQENINALSGSSGHH